jgi:hypothetical protein
MQHNTDLVCITMLSAQGSLSHFLTIGRQPLRATPATHQVKAQGKLQIYRAIISELIAIPCVIEVQCIHIAEFRGSCLSGARSQSLIHTRTLWRPLMNA